VRARWGAPTARLPQPLSVPLNDDRWAIKLKTKATVTNARKDSDTLELTCTP
jgi:hypothetical protein